MAYGGWLMAQGNIGPVTNGLGVDADLETLVNQVLNLLATDSGWSVKKPATKFYYSDRAYYGVCQHTLGAEFAVIWVGNATATPIWNSINFRGAAQSGGSSSDATICCAYHAPGTGSFDNAKTPLDADWSLNPTTMFGLQDIFVNDGVAWGTTYQVWTFLARADGSLALAIAGNAGVGTEVDRLILWGDILDSLQHDPDDTNTLAAISYGTSIPLNTSVPNIDIFNAAGDTVLLATRPDFNTLISATYTTPPPYNAMRLSIINDVAEGPVFNGDGVKGKTNPEAFFVTAVGSLAGKETWNSGTHIHLINGVWVGFDTGNPSWP